MKEYLKKISLVLATCTFLFSCDKFLEENPKDKLPEDDVYNSISEVYLNAVASLYTYVGGYSDSQGLQGTGRGVYDLNTFTTDEAIIPTRGGDWYDGGFWQGLFLHDWGIENDAIQATWEYLYKVVMLSNKSLERIDKFAETHSDAELPAYRAEVRAMRAMYYYYLLDLFGRVPLVQSSSPAMIRGLTIDYNVFLLCEAVIVWGLIFPTIRKYSPDPLLTLFCLYCTLLPVLGMNRQLISLAISIYSIRFILNRQWIFFYLSILLACPFHFSILIFAVAYFLNSKLKTKYYVLLLVVCIGLSVFDVIDKYFGEIVPYVSGDDTRLMGYTEIESTGVNASFLGIARKSLWLFLSYPLLKKEREGLLLLSFNLYFLSLLIYTIFNGTDFQIIVSRGTNYFTIYEVFIVSYVVYGYKGKGVKIIMLIMIFVYFIGMLYKGIDYYSVGRYNPFIPYQFCF